MADNGLPFNITAHVGTRGMVAFTASVGGERITSERYTPGDGKRRRDVARLWAGDARLTNGEALDLDVIAAELERVEFQATDAIEDVENQGDGPEPIEVASYADDNSFVELAWNIETNAPDFIVYDRHTGNLQIGLPLLAVARSDDARQRIIEALRTQQADVAADRSETLAGDVFAVLVDHPRRTRRGTDAASGTRWTRSEWRNPANGSGWPARAYTAYKPTQPSPAYTGKPPWRYQKRR